MREYINNILICEPAQSQADAQDNFIIIIIIIAENNKERTNRSWRSTQFARGSLR